MTAPLDPTSTGSVSEKRVYEIFQQVGIDITGPPPPGHLTAVELSSAQLLDLHNTPVVVVPAMARKMVSLISAPTIQHNFATVPFQNADNAQLVFYSAGLPSYDNGSLANGSPRALGYQANLLSLISLYASNDMFDPSSVAGHPLEVRLDSPITGGDGSAIVTIAYFYIEVA